MRTLTAMLNAIHGRLIDPTTNLPVGWPGDKSGGKGSALVFLIRRIEGPTTALPGGFFELWTGPSGRGSELNSGRVVMNRSIKLLGMFGGAAHGFGGGRGPGRRAVEASGGKGAEGCAFYNIREFGAVGDSVTWDTEAINSAVNACAAGGGGVCVVRAGGLSCRGLYGAGAECDAVPGGGGGVAREPGRIDITFMRGRR